MRSSTKFTLSSLKTNTAEQMSLLVKDEDSSSPDEHPHPAPSLSAVLTEQDVQKAFQEGKNEAKRQYDHQFQSILQNIHRDWKRIVATDADMNQAVEKKVCEIIQSIFPKLFKTLEQIQGLDEIMVGLKACLADLHVSTCTLYVHSERVAPLEKALAESLAYPSHLSLSCQKDDTLGMADFRIVWDKGGAEHRKSKPLDTFLDHITQQLGKKVST